jgi:hypothetical protein
MLILFLFTWISVRLSSFEYIEVWNQPTSISVLGKESDGLFVVGRVPKSDYHLSCVIKGWSDDELPKALTGD